MKPGQARGVSEARASQRGGSLLEWRSLLNQCAHYVVHLLSCCVCMYLGNEATCCKVSR